MGRQRSEVRGQRSVVKGWAALVIRISTFFRHWDLVIRHWSLVTSDHGHDHFGFTPVTSDWPSFSSPDRTSVWRLSLSPISTATAFRNSPSSTQM